MTNIKWYTSDFDCADKSNIPSEHKYIIKENTEALLVASREISLEINAE